MIIERFLANLGVQDSLLIENEMIEHNVSITTLDKIDKLNQFFQDHPELHQQFLNYPPE